MCPNPSLTVEPTAQPRPGDARATAVSGFLQWWSNDQTFFNEVVHRAQPMAQLGLALKAADGATRDSAAEIVRAARPALGRLAGSGALHNVSDWSQRMRGLALATEPPLSYSIASFATCSSSA